MCTSRICGANCPSYQVIQRSTAGYVLTIFGSRITRQTKLQKTVAVCTAKVKTRTASTDAKNAVNHKEALQDLVLGSQCILIYREHQAEVHSNKHSLTVAHAKHVNFSHHFVRNRGSSGELTFHFIETKSRSADFLVEPEGPPN